MQQDVAAQQKADQIAHRFFSKFALVVDNARNVVSEQREDARADKWFNLETPDSDLYREQIRLYKSISQLGAPPPPLELQVLLTVPELTDKQVLVQHPPNSSRMRVEPTPTHVLLESWSLTFIGANPESPTSSQLSTGEVTLATVYKHIMSVMRSLYTLLRVLPAWKICKRLRRRPGAGTGARNGQLGLMLRVRARGTDASASEDMRYLGFDEPLSPNASPLATTTYTFEPVTHPMGVFSAIVTYLKAPHFELDTVEALLSSRFLSLDVGPGFTPTLARNSQRESMSGSPGSLPMRTSLPLSPPSDRTDKDKTGVGLALGTGAISNIADRFVFPVASGSRTSLPSTSPRSRNTPLPAAGPVQRSISAQQAQAAVGTGSAGSIGSSSRHSREEGRESLPSLARVRRESTGMGRGSDLPSTPAPLLIRRPSANVSPFKSGALSSGSPSLYSNSPSLRHASPLAGPSLPSAPAGRPTSAAVPPSPTSARVPGARGDTGTGAGPSSPILAYRTGSSPVLPLRPSPPTPFAPSSLGERRFPSSPAPGELVPSGTQPLNAPPRKRYSSTFGYRYAAAGSEGSAGSGEKGKDPERPGSASYLSANTDDDDISAFVQEIDARKPIGGGFNTSHDRERTLSEAGLEGRAVLAGAEVPERAQGTQTPEGQNVEQPRAVRSHSRRMSEGSRRSPLAREAAATAESREDASSGQAGAALNQVAIDERLRALNDAFRTSMGLVERRPSTIGEASEASESMPSPFPSRPSFPIPGASHLRTPSFPASGGTGIPSDRPSSAPGQTHSSSSSEAVVPRRRLIVTPGGSLGGDRENISIWDNRRLRGRADSTGSGSSASGLSELDRARLFYGQGRGARGSGASVSGASLESEEAVGRMSLERADQ